MTIDRRALIDQAHKALDEHPQAIIPSLLLRIERVLTILLQLEEG